MGWWFGRKQAAADARPYVPSWSALGLTTACSEVGLASYETQFDEVFRRNPVGQRSVRLLSGMLSSLTIDGDERAVALVKADGLLETITANLLLQGNAYPSRLHFLRVLQLRSVASGRTGSCFGVRRAT